MTQKRGQVTLFIILGIILLILASLWFYSQRAALPETGVEAPDAKKIQLFVEECVRQTAVPGAFLLGFQGGELYSTLTGNEPDAEIVAKNLITQQRGLPYLMVNGRKTHTKTELLARVSQHFSTYLAQNLPACTDFTPFLRQGMFIDELPPSAETKIAADTLHFDVAYPLDVTQEEKNFQLNRFRAQIPSRLGTLINVADEMLDIITQNPAKANLPAFSRLNQQYDVRITVLPYNHEVTVYAVYDDDEKQHVDGAALVFWFAVRNSFGEQDSASFGPNTPPRFNAPIDFVLRKGAPFEYELDVTDAEGDAVQFSSDAASVPVTPDGTIRFVPISRSTFFVTFTATDSRGMSNAHKIRFVVE